MTVYDLLNPLDLEFDLKRLLDRIGETFDIQFVNHQINVTSIWEDDSNEFWASISNTLIFNKNIPTFKSIHVDMYSFIESYYRLTYGKYDYKKLEENYPNYREFRHLNNIIKHPKVKDVEISFTKIAYINSKKFDLMCNFKYHDKFICLPYSAFILLFLNFLADQNLITF
jgi:hypothetical protein